MADVLGGHRRHCRVMSTTQIAREKGPELQVDGELPADLDGAFVRAGPDPICRHLRPADGDGLLHRLVLADGRARFAEESLGRALPSGICVRPRLDPRTGELIAFRTGTRPPFLTWTVIRPDGTGTPPRPVEGVGRPSVIHDMAITDRFVVLVVAPLLIDGSFPHVGRRRRHPGRPGSPRPRARALVRGRGVLAVAHRQRAGGEGPR